SEIFWGWSVRHPVLRAGVATTIRPRRWGGPDRLPRPPARPAGANRTQPSTRPGRPRPLKATGAWRGARSGGGPARGARRPRRSGTDATRVREGRVTIPVPGLPGATHHEL